MKKRGANRGSTQTPWTDDEWAIIHHALDHGNKGTRAKDCEALLPGRSRENIHNALNIARRRRAKLCIHCGQAPQTPGHASCEPCRTKQREQRRARIKNGCCASCGDSLDQPGCSGTHCPRCRQRRKKYVPKDNKRFTAKSPRDKSRRILPWPACGHIKWAARLAAATQRPVIDPFGGSGEPLRLVHEHGGCPHAYYDLHPGVVALVQAAKDGRQDEVAEAIKNHDLYNRAAATYINARKPGALYDRRFTLNMKRLGQALSETTVQQANALNLLREPDLFPTNAIFIIDPPWPGSTTAPPFEYTLDDEDYSILMTALLDLPYEQDYILMLGSEREALTLAAQHMRHAPLYWRAHGPRFTKSIVSLSPRLAREAPDGEALGIPIHLEALGL